MTNQSICRGVDFSLYQSALLWLGEHTFKTEDCISLAGVETLKTSCGTKEDKNGADSRRTEQNRAGREEGMEGNQRGTE